MTTQQISGLLIFNYFASAALNICFIRKFRKSGSYVSDLLVVFFPILNTVMAIMSLIVTIYDYSPLKKLHRFLFD